jgi:hypothetical protein
MWFIRTRVAQSVYSLSAVRTGLYPGRKNTIFLSASCSEYPTSYPMCTVDKAVKRGRGVTLNTRATTSAVVKCKKKLSSITCSKTMLLTSDSLLPFLLPRTLLWPNRCDCNLLMFFKLSSVTDSQSQCWCKTANKTCSKVIQHKKRHQSCYLLQKNRPVTRVLRVLSRTVNQKTISVSELVRRGTLS